jgi:hypothetical protein
MSSGTESRRRAPILRASDRFPAEPARRIVVASLAILLLLAAALGVTIWRYESALSRYQSGALEARDDAELVKDAIGFFWQEQAAIFNYAAQQNDQVLVRLDSARKNFVASLSRVDARTGVESDLRSRALAANRASNTNFVENVKPALAGAPGKHPRRAGGLGSGRCRY